MLQFEGQLPEILTALECDNSGNKLVSRSSSTSWEKPLLELSLWTAPKVLKEEIK